MPKKSRSDSPPIPQQLPLDFSTIIASAEVLSRAEVVARTRADESASKYSPVVQTAHYMRQAVQLEDAWETIVQQARESLLDVDARQVYLDFLTDLAYQVNHHSPNSARLSFLLEHVAIRGLGMSHNHVHIERPMKGGMRWHVNIDNVAVERHLRDHIVGERFLNPVTIEGVSWKTSVPLIGASDVSQHRSAVPVG